MSFPEIVTDRLVLRVMTLDDFERYAEIWRQPEVVKYIGSVPRSREESWASFMRNAGCWSLMGYGQWGAWMRDSGQLVGQVGFMASMRGVGEDFDAAPECGWVLSKEAQGRGLGLEAVTAAHRWFDAQSFGGTSHAMIEKGHRNSLKVARAVGYVEMRETQFAGDPVILLERVRGAGAV